MSISQGNADDDLVAIIVNGDTQRLIEKARTVGERLFRQGLTATQIRGVFTKVRQIELQWSERDQDGDAKAIRQLLLLQPKLDYQARRHVAVAELRDVLNAAIPLVNGNRQRFSNFMDFFEAILAYHVAAGGK